MELEEWKAQLVKELREELDAMKWLMRQQRDAKMEFLWYLDTLISRLKSYGDRIDYPSKVRITTLEDVMKAMTIYPGSLEMWQVRDAIADVVRAAEDKHNYDGKEQIYAPDLHRERYVLNHLLKLAKEMEGKYE